MNEDYPIPPVAFEESSYVEQWFKLDYLFMSKGAAKVPDHHCKRTFNLSRRFISRLGLAVDVGARDGEFARYLQHYFPKTICFDPKPRLENFAENVDLSKTWLFQTALGDASGEIDMYGRTHERQNGAHSRVRTEPLDAFKLEDLSYLKIDTEGYELRVLQGAEQTILRDKPLIVIAQNKTVLDGEPSMAAKAWLEDRGYHHVATDERGWDFIMQHQSSAPADQETVVRLWGLTKIGGFYLPEDDSRFSVLGDAMCDYQVEGRREALRFATQRRCALDIGANIGIFAADFAKSFDHVIAFEPLETNVKCLTLNLPGNTEIIAAAVGDAEGTVRIYQARKTLGNSYITNHDGVSEANPHKYDPSREVEVPLITIDSLERDDVDLIKLDIQGAEYIALQGAAETIKRCRPVILVEEKAIGADTRHIEQVKDLLLSLGMTQKERIGADRIWVFETS